MSPGGVKRPFLPSRRDVLIAGAATALSCGRTEVIDAGGPFPLGVASGDPLPTGALLWTRFTGEGPLWLEVWAGEAGASAPVFASEVAVVEQTARVEVAGLTPSTRYTYAFTDATGVQSRLGNFRTAFGPDELLPLRFGATSCTNFGFPMDAVEQLGQREDLALVAMLGDNVYADEAVDRPGYRAFWHQMLGTPGWRATRANSPLVATWDDHEVVNNWSGETVAPARFAAAVEEFFAHQPARRDPSAPSRLWRRLRYGRTAELFVLDSRGERKPSTRTGPEAQYLSPAQLAWLKEGLATSPAVFKVILNSVPITEFPGTLFQSQVADRWEGYPAQRLELLSFIDDNAIGGVLWIAGDFHLASMGRVARVGPGSTQVEALVGPGANIANPSPSYPAPPQFDFSSGINNYTLIDLDPSTREARLRYVDGSGRTFGEGRYVL